VARMPDRRVVPPLSMTYAIVRLGGKQYRVQEGEKLVVDRLAVEENKAFHPEVLFVGGDGQAELAPKGVQVTAKVVGHVLGDKIRIGKYKKRTGYRRHNGFRAKLSQVQIETIAKKAARATTAAKPAAEEKPAAAAKPSAAAKPTATAKPRRTAARRPAAPRKKAE
jgi:large subunit ribosomal protein L21